jgi:hypothetical protein
MLRFISIEAAARLHSAGFRVMKHREALLDVEEQSLAVQPRVVAHVAERARTAAMRTAAPSWPREHTKQFRLIDTPTERESLDDQAF